MPQEPLVAGVLLFEQVEVLDFAGPFEVFSRARHQGGPCFRALTLAPTPEVMCVDGLVVRPHCTLAEAPPLDILVVSGGPGAREPVDPEPIVAFIREQAPKVRVLASVCTGAAWLARAGALNGLSVATHPSFRQQLAEDYPAVSVVPSRLVDHGRIITAGGIASGVDLALHLLERYYGWEVRRQEALRLDGPWR